jgi:hypothetical protein
MSKSITVTVHDDHLDRIDALADQLRAAGMQVDQVLSSTGIITGEVTDAQQQAIAELPGVAAVENEQEYQLPPPDAGIQ